ncbi:phospholipase D gamma 1-like [Andrographis paniculata]|uniref:phospholipase D gamma 1-like n=1 Tax=Andrographis paniculata TaxID=175694 RepID=UPI0021E8C544|nr:phospholipase D gamma 1-like [Andrographis paniculata]XP_051145390.1 phospholipase D gamma 1-like [Andrographis paniculata]
MNNQNHYPPPPPPPPYPYNPGYGYPHGPAPPSQYPNPGYGPPPPSYPSCPEPYPYPQQPHYPPPYSQSPSGHLNYAYPNPSAPFAPPPAPHYASGYGSDPYQHHLYPTVPAPPPSAPPPSLDPPHPIHHNLQHQPSGRLQPPHIQTESPPKPNDHSNYPHYQGGSFYVDDPLVNSNRLDDSSPSYPSLYPRIDDQLESMHLSDAHHKPSAPASPPGPSSALIDPTMKFHSGPLPRTDKLDMVSSYGSHSSSFSRLEQSQLGKADSFSSTNVSYGLGMQLVPASPSKSSLKVLLLHGNLDIWVYEAKNLPNMDMFHKTLGDMFNRLPGNMSSKIEGQMKNKITSDPYVSITVTGAAIARTYVISNSEDPVWNQNFVVPVAHHAAEVNFVVKDSDVVGSQLIGTVSIPVEHIYGGEKIQGFFPILNASGKPCKPGAVLRLEIQYYPMEQLSIYHNGVGAGPNYVGAPGTYFPLRRGGTVTLYQDAHVPDGSLPILKLDNGMHYVHGKCWHDIFDAIRNARRLVYITGWSVWHKVRLIRDGESVSNYTLGELLKSKSQEGVRVLLLVWDDPTSRNILGYKTDGVMQTHDEETRRFFKHSSVQVLLCPRAAGKKHSWVKQREVEVIYTHHQKTVIVDADAGNNRRRIIAFVGGLDLCDGRYDTPQHHIFRTLQTLHSDDYHNPTFAGNVDGCPREPWHDLHSKIDGPAAYDVLKNFEERWQKASKRHGIKKLKMSDDDALLRLDRMPEILEISDAPCLHEDHPEAWHVQVFRSIDSNSVKGFPKDPKDGPARNLVCGKNVLIDMSIHTAYVKAIRAAQHFIYIENQYFIGSSYNWSQHKGVGADNLIPMEIALKIAEKIRARERFAAYIVIPMWPEGNPTGAPTQRILFWQNKTMQMMYETIYKALVEVELETTHSPQDYLNFFCLGNREAVDAGTSVESPPAANTPQGLCRKSRRFMIYVHSKGMIVDDEYVIIGSANINQRSMEGTRDTEIAMGAYQPHYTWARKLSSPQGQIYGYRMSLWAEHLGFLEDCFTQPESLECVQRVRSLGEANWEQFASPTVSEMRGHLLKYPVEVDQKGKVKPLKGCETFPDVGGNIVGSFIAIQENLTI